MNKNELRCAKQSTHANSSNLYFSNSGICIDLECRLNRNGGMRLIPS